MLIYSIMSILKKVKDSIIKQFMGDTVPRGLFESREYFRHYEPIKFEYKNESGQWIAISKNFRYGSIITSAKTKSELDKNISDAILTSFGIPSSYKKEAGIHKVGQKSKEYAIA